MTDFRNIPPQNVIAVLEAGTTQDSVSMVEKGNTQYPEISSLVAGDGVTLSKNLNKSVTITSSTPTITHINLTENGKIKISDEEKGLEASQLQVGDPIFNFCNILDHNDYVELNGSVSLVKQLSDQTGTLRTGKSSFVVTINHNFPSVTYNGSIYMGGSVSHYTTANTNWITGARILPPTNTNKELNGIELEIATTDTDGSTLSNDIEELEIRFSLMYKK